MYKRITTWLLMASVISCLISCGQTGRLYLPKSDQTKQNTLNTPPEISADAG